MKTLLISLLLATSAPCAALAQDQPPPGGRGAFMQACGQDVQNFCGSARGRDQRRACLMANRDKFSDSCKAFMASHPMHQHQPMQAPPNGQPQ